MFSLAPLAPAVNAKEKGTCAAESTPTIPHERRAVVDAAAAARIPNMEVVRVPVHRIGPLATPM